MIGKGRFRGYWPVTTPSAHPPLEAMGGVGASDPTLGDCSLLTHFPISSRLYKLFVTLCGDYEWCGIRCTIKLQGAALFCSQLRLQTQVDRFASMGYPSVRLGALQITKNRFKRLRYSYQINQTQVHVPVKLNWSTGFRLNGPVKLLLENGDLCTTVSQL